MGTIYFDNEFITVQDPQVPLAPGAVEIVVKRDDAKTYERVYDVYRKLQNYWSTTLVDAKPLAVGRYYIERRDVNANTSLRQIIPYPTGGFASVVRQLQVAWNLLFPNRAWTSIQTLGEVEAIQNCLNSEELPDEPTVGEGTDAFCNEERIKAQQIHEFPHVRLQQNFKPLTENDMLITSKEHTSDFTKVAFVEAMKTGVKINDIYSKEGFAIGYQTFADHPAAGQTIAHAHIHVTNARNFTEELYGVLKVVRKIFIDSWMQFIAPCLFRLSDRQLEVIIAKRQDDLKSILK